MNTTNTDKIWGGGFQPAREEGFELVEVDSSFIDSIGYKENMLRVVFEREDGTYNYDYFGVSKKVFRRFLEASSKGRFYHLNIKGQYTRVKED